MFLQILWPQWHQTLPVFLMFLAAASQMSLQHSFSFQSLSTSGLPSFLLIYFLLSWWIINGICVGDHLCSSSDISPKFQIHLANFTIYSFLSNSHLQTHSDQNCIHHSLSKTTCVPFTKVLEGLFHFPLSLTIFFPLHLQVVPFHLSSSLILPLLSIPATLALVNSSLIGCNIL